MNKSIRDVIAKTEAGDSQRAIARATKVSRSKVQRIQERIVVLPENWNDLSDDELNALIYPKPETQSTKERIDFEHIHSELTKHHNLTLMVLWREYFERCVQEGKEAYQYSYFAELYMKYVLCNKATMPLHKKAGTCEVDWSGDHGHYKDPAEMVEKEVHVFVGVLPYSQYMFICGFDDEKLESWIEAHVRMFKAFGGVPHTIICDNLKTGVTKPSKYEAELIIDEDNCRCYPYLS